MFSEKIEPFKGNYAPLEQREDIEFPFFNQSAEREPVAASRSMLKSVLIAGALLGLGVWAVSTNTVSTAMLTQTTFDKQNTAMLELISDNDEFCPDGTPNLCYGNACKAQGDLDASCKMDFGGDTPTYNCHCSKAYLFGETTCEKKSACSSNPCDQWNGAVCVDTLANEYICKCPTGWYSSEDGHTCTEVDGCEHGAGKQACGGDQGFNGICHALHDGSTGYTCECAGGFIFIDGSCQDYHPCECLQDLCQDEAGVAHGQCVDELPTDEQDDASKGYNCDCDANFEEKDGNGKCSNIDYCQGEWEKNALFCRFSGDVDAECEDLDDGYNCKCSEQLGWERTAEPAITCSDQDYCVEDAHCECVDNKPDEATGRSYQLVNCHHCYEVVPEGSECTNDCQWKSQLVDQCTTDSVDNNGESNCKKHGDTGATCESTHRVTDENEECGYSCACSEGYTFEDGTCVDFKECDESGKGLEFCQQGSSDATCVEGEYGDGKYTCVCGSGFQCADDACHECREVDVCVDQCAHGECQDHKSGQSNPWSFHCECDKCYVSQDVDCQDSYATFRTSLNLATNEAVVDGESEYCGEQCVDANECDDVGNAACGEGSALATCSHSVGDCEWWCDCGSGFECADKACQSCKPVDPCADDELLCDHGACVDNTADSDHPWSYTCACEEGYDSVAKECSKFEEYTQAPDVIAGESADCGFKCVDHIDCEAGLAVCQAAKDAFASCVEGPAGSQTFSCLCSDGFQCNDDECTVCLPVNPCTLFADTQPLCGNGACIDDEPTGETDGERQFDAFHCDCKACFEAQQTSVSKLLGEPVTIRFGVGKHDVSHPDFAEQCVDINDCDATDNGLNGRARCTESDAAASCADVGSCAYTCTCSDGYECADDACTGCEETVPEGNECGDAATLPRGTTRNVAPPLGGLEDPTGIYTCTCNDCYALDVVEGFQGCVDANECADNDECGEHGTCQQGEAGTCAWSCVCEDGFDCDDEDCHSCAPINICEGMPEFGVKEWALGGPKAAASCGEHGDCLDADFGSGGSCDCHKCYEADDEAFTCNEIDECAVSGLAACQLEGDTAATCTDELCDYSCTCSEGYREINGVCVDQNDCEPSNACGADSDAGACVDNAAPATGYACYCNCGYFFNQNGGFEATGSCDSCKIEFEFYGEDPEQNKADGYISNDDKNLYINIRANSNDGKLIFGAVNVNAANAETITTQNDGRTYKLDGSATGDYSCGPKPRQFGVEKGEFLHQVFWADKETPSQVPSYTFTIPLDDVEVNDDCTVTVMVYTETYNEEADGKLDRSYALAEGSTTVTQYGSDQACDNEGFFSYFTYEICGHPKCAGA